ncbi:Xyloglucan 6-xylosyltransferase [Escovopsis weberi]|uniref:Xyloglucan 6-xylosyltransferase n=1 Tax=Escovopsis weberi TaxID=150374 RepID=A0A0M8MWU7_ESCWE|nr:Xyloglucan 6-xylosyltransferase [Escovopsis weberi]
MLVGGLRTNMTVLVIGAAVFITAMAGLIYNQLDSPSESDAEIISTPDVASKEKQEATSPDAEADFQKSLWFDMYKPSVKPDAPTYKQYGVAKHTLKTKPAFTEPLGEDFCIIDLDSRPFSEPFQIFGPEILSWDRFDKVHGLAMGFLNHWLYAKVHGYKYYYIAAGTYGTRRDSWKKPTIITKILQKHKACVYLDSDAIFNNLDLPFEWLMNYWDLDPANNSLALAYDPEAKGNEDNHGKINLNTGFIISQNNEKTFEIMDAWDKCTEPDGKYPGCEEFRKAAPGRPTDQGGFGSYVRYDYPTEIKSLPCQEANGFPGSNSGCEGTFIRHVWTGKDSWLKAFVGQQVLGPFLESFHKEFLAEKDSFYITEEVLMSS